jgi:hypothetical protein
LHIGESGVVSARQDLSFREGENLMVRHLTFLVASAGLLGLAWPSAARAYDCDPQAAVEKDLQDRGARAYTITPVTKAYIRRAFPGKAFFEVRFIQYPIAVAPPKGLSSSNVFVVDENCEVTPLTRPAELVAYFEEELPQVQNNNQAKAAGRAFLRLLDALFQDGFYTFSPPKVIVRNLGDGTTVVSGSVSVTAGGNGALSAELDFDANGDLTDVEWTGGVKPGVRPICQATKLLDADPLVRRMAEQGLLVMGRSAKGYLNEQRAKANPELKGAIDRLWKRIVAEGW